MTSEGGDESALHPIPQLDCFVEGCTHNPSAIGRKLYLQQTGGHAEILTQQLHNMGNWSSHAVEDLQSHENIGTCLARS